MLERLNFEGVIEALERLGPPGLLAFDADGTLWSGDAGEDVFVHAIQEGFLKEAHIEEALRDVARDARLSPEGSVGELCMRIFDAYNAGSFDERLVCEVMTWCYAGHSVQDMLNFAKEALHGVAPGRVPLADRFNPALVAILEWARGRGCRCVVVSASPKFVLDAGAARLGFAPEDIVGARPVLDGDQIQARMDGEVPYGPDKAAQGALLTNGGPWLASFGDSQFDIDLLRCARLAVGVTPKPTLRESLAQLDFSCELV